MRRTDRWVDSDCRPVLWQRCLAQHQPKLAIASFTKAAVYSRAVVFAMHETAQVRLLLSHITEKVAIVSVSLHVAMKQSQSERKDSDPIHESCKSHLHLSLPEACRCLICKVVYLFTYRLMPPVIQRRRLWGINTKHKHKHTLWALSLLVWDAALADETQTGRNHNYVNIMINKKQDLYLICYEGDVRSLIQAGEGWRLIRFTENRSNYFN